MHFHHVIMYTITFTHVAKFDIRNLTKRVFSESYFGCNAHFYTYSHLHFYSYQVELFIVITRSQIECVSVRACVCCPTLSKIVKVRWRNYFEN